MEKNTVGSGASGTPVGLVNPATGRKANLSWEAENCYRVIKKNLEKVQDSCKQSFYTQSGVLRPAVDDESFTYFRQAWERNDWPSGWQSWMSAEEVREANPYLVETKGGLLINTGLSIRVPEFLHVYAKELTRKGAEIFSEQDYELISDEHHWKLKSTEIGTLKADSVIFTGGHTVILSDYWRDIPIHPVKGQISRYTAKERLNWKIPIAASGYFARSGEKDFIVGGTYEHDFDNEHFDDKGIRILEDKLRRTMPALLEKSSLTSQWSGIRASTPNRLPILGPHPHKPNLYVFSGLGSKGLLYSKYTAELLAGFLIHQTKLPKEVDVNRFSSKKQN